LKTVAEIYAEIPRLNCQRKCQECCGPIAMSGIEWFNLTQYLGYRPIVPRVVADKAAMGTIPYRFGTTVFMECVTCPLLNPHDGSCMAYEVRPLICRIWGTVPKLRCPWGCLPERWLTDIEASKIMGQLTVAIS